MNVDVDPFLAFENEFVDIHAVFHEEAYALLSSDRIENDADILFAKVDNLLNVASEILEYNRYIDLIAAVSMQCAHDHALSNLLEKSSHGEKHDSHLQNIDAQHNHSSDSKEVKKDSKAKAKKALGKITTGNAAKKIKNIKQPTKVSWFAMLMGVK